MLFIRSRWNRFKGQTDWKDGDPEAGLIHTVCGHDIIQVTHSRTVWESGGPGPCASHGTENVSDIYCSHCDQEPPPVKPGEPIQRADVFDPVDDA